MSAAAAATPPTDNPIGRRRRRPPLPPPLKCDEMRTMTGSIWTNRKNFLYIRSRRCCVIRSIRETSKNQHPVKVTPDYIHTYLYGLILDSFCRFGMILLPPPAPLLLSSAVLLVNKVKLFFLSTSLHYVFGASMPGLPLS